jgi:hypothetical protein
MFSGMAGLRLPELEIYPPVEDPATAPSSFWKDIFSCFYASVTFNLPVPSILFVELSDIMKLCFLSSSKNETFSFY